MKKNISFQLEERAAKRLGTLDKLNGISTPSRPETAKQPQLKINSHPSHSATSPHDLALATSRLRAPVLRVYVPCSQLTRTPQPPPKEGEVTYVSYQTMELRASGPATTSALRPDADSSNPEQAPSLFASSIEKVEAELMSADLWGSMRGGEVVVNFGYMPGASVSQPHPLTCLSCSNITL